MLNCGHMKTPSKLRGARGDGRPRPSLTTEAKKKSKKKSSPVSAAGLQRRILQTIAKIPQGKVSTYGAVATPAGFPGRARLVGQTLHSSRAGEWYGDLALRTVMN